MLSLTDLSPKAGPGLSSSGFELLELFEADHRAPRRGSGGQPGKTIGCRSPWMQVERGFERETGQSDEEEPHVALQRILSREMLGGLINVTLWRILTLTAPDQIEETMDQIQKLTFNHLIFEPRALRSCYTWRMELNTRLISFSSIFFNLAG